MPLTRIYSLPLFRVSSFCPKIPRLPFSKIRTTVTDNRPVREFDCAVFPEPLKDCVVATGQRIRSIPFSAKPACQYIWQTNRQIKLKESDLAEAAVCAFVAANTSLKSTVKISPTLRARLSFENRPP